MRNLTDRNLTDRGLTGRQILFVAACTLALVSLGVGIVGLVHGPWSPSRRDGHVSLATTADVSVTIPPAGPVQVGRRALPQTDDPIAYAKAVAVALFSWDTSTGSMPADVSAPIIADADPTGRETVGLLSDVATYLPTDEQWMDLAALRVSQTIDIATAVVPKDWPAIVANSRGQLAQGTAAVTIDATRARSGSWTGDAATSSHEVSFTVFVACPPVFDRCRVLRLSRLDKPLR